VFVAVVGGPCRQPGIRNPFPGKQFFCQAGQIVQPQPVQRAGAWGAYRGVYEHQRRLRAEESARKLFIPASYRGL
jgi:hypothetical protein